jgi:hypothetical protein
MTAYYATFELKSGLRREFSLNGSDFGQLAEGDSGQLRYQGAHYLSFQRSAAPVQPPPPAPSLICDYCKSAIATGSIKCASCGWTWHPSAQDRAMT